jgi:hypothetical protein
MTEEQVAAIQPFLKKLLKRYQEVADTGMTEQPDPICATLHHGKVDLTCVDCPVWGVRQYMGRTKEVHKKRGVANMPDDNVPFIHCEDYYPKRPEDMTDDTQRVVHTVGGSRQAERIRDAQAWGWNVVMWLEGLQR